MAGDRSKSEHRGVCVCVWGGGGGSFNIHESNGALYCYKVRLNVSSNVALNVPRDHKEYQGTGSPGRPPYLDFHTAPELCRRCLSSVLPLYVHRDHQDY